MTRRIHTVVAALATITIFSLNTAPVHAGGGCGRGRIGFSIGHGRVGVSVSHVRSRRGHVHPPIVQPPPVYSQPVYAQPVYSPSTFPTSPPTGISQQPLRPAPANTSRAPVTQTAIAQPRTTQRPTTQPQPVTSQVPGKAGSPANTNTSEASALQLLASIAGEEYSTSKVTTKIPEFTAAKTPATSPHTGSWKVSLPGNQSVELALNENGDFRWTATKDGKSSSFEGQYRLEAGRLTLVRSSDLQQMAGAWTGQGSTFTFKLDGATNSGLAFVRS